jgi:hypothetical protein
VTSQQRLWSDRVRFDALKPLDRFDVQRLKDLQF